MPELPEVETVKRGLHQHLAGKQMIRVLLRRPDLRVALPGGLCEALKDKRLLAIERRAKYLLFHFEGNQVLIAHLGMSGSFLLAREKPARYRKHDHVVFEFSQGWWLMFHDPRRFGLMALAPTSGLHAHPLLKALGPEPLDDTVDGHALYVLLHTSKAPVKSVIMDQRKLVGVGNIYACEALFRAGIHPARAANTITKAKAHALMTAIKEVLREAIDSGGSTLRDYVRSSGDAGYFQHHFSVYGRTQLPCLRCSAPVKMIRQSGRSTFFCAHCQR